MHITELHTLIRVKRDPFGSIDPVPDYIDVPSTQAEEDLILLTHHVAYRIIAPIIVSTGILGNILTILILRNPIFRGVMYNFFISLALFDFLSLVFSISGLIHILNPATSSYITVTWYSYFEVLLINSAMGTSVLIVVCITFDRYMSVCHPYNFKTWHTTRYCKISIGCSFAISFLLWIPTSFLKAPSTVIDCETFDPIDDIVHENSTLWVSCQRDDFYEYPLYASYAWIREIILSFLPIAIVIVLNAFLVKYFVEKHKLRAMSHSSGTPPRIVVSPTRQVGDANLKGLLKAIMICFFVTIFPAGIFNAVYSEQLTTSFKYELFRAYANLLELLNHTLNFYLYILLCKPIRSALPSLFSSFKTSVTERLQAPKLAVINVLPKNEKDFLPSVASETLQRDTTNQLSKIHYESKSDSGHTQFSEVTTDANLRENHHRPFSNDSKNTENRDGELVTQSTHLTSDLPPEKESP